VPRFAPRPRFVFMLSSSTCASQYMANTGHCTHHRQSRARPPSHDGDGPTGSEQMLVVVLLPRPLHSAEESSLREHGMSDMVPHEGGICMSCF
jgi:hypothetical protein